MWCESRSDELAYDAELITDANTRPETKPKTREPYIVERIDASIGLTLSPQPQSLGRRCERRNKSINRLQRPCQHKTQYPLHWPCQRHLVQHHALQRNQGQRENGSSFDGWRPYTTLMRSMRGQKTCCSNMIQFDVHSGSQSVPLFAFDSSLPWSRWRGKQAQSVGGTQAQYRTCKAGQRADGVGDPVTLESERELDIHHDSTVPVVLPESRSEKDGRPRIYQTAKVSSMHVSFTERGYIAASWSSYSEGRGTGREKGVSPTPPWISFGLAVALQ